MKFAWEIIPLPNYFSQSSEGVWILIEREKENIYQMCYMSLFNNGTFKILSNININNTSTYFISSHNENRKNNYTNALISLNEIELILCNQFDATQCQIKQIIKFPSFISEKMRKIFCGIFIEDLNYLYIGTDSGLHILNLETYQMIYYYNEINESVTSLTLTLKYQTIFIGTKTKLWLETYSQDIHQWRFEHINGLIDSSITSLEYNEKQDKLWIGQNTGITLVSPIKMSNGYINWYFSRLSGKISNPGSDIGHLPFSNITCLSISHSSNCQIWLGSIYGLMRYDCQINTWRVFNSGRYLPNRLSQVHISSIGVIRNIENSLSNSIVSITNRGLSIIHFQKWTLQKKAEYFQTYLDQSNRHKRYDLISDCHMSLWGDPRSCIKYANDNDGLWTSMYLSSQIFRYIITNDTQVKQQSWKHFQALQFLNKITGISGYPARSIAKKDEFPPSSDWYESPINSSFIYKSDTSSDEIVGHEFIYPLVYDYLCNTHVKKNYTKI